jgi:sulfur-oxidizing protein SoxY
MSSRMRPAALLASAAVYALLWGGATRAEEHPDPWPELRSQIFQDRATEDGRGVLALDAPYRAEDAAIVPITIRVLLPPEDGRQVRRITLVIDENPSPLAATFDLAPGSGVDRIATRVRVDSYTNIHAVAELSDGRLYAAERFVKAAGGCSAPALKQIAEGVPLGTMRLRTFAHAPDAPSGASEAELMIRHPNYSGMQMDQVTRLYVPAHFVKTVRVSQDGSPLLSIESGISISENPDFRFDYKPNGAQTIRAEMVDSRDAAFTGEWPAPAAGS